MLPLFLFIFTLSIQYLCILLVEHHSFFSHCFCSVEVLLWGAELLVMKYCPPFPVKNPRKMKEKQNTNYPRSEEVTTAIEQNPGKDPPAIVFFAAEVP
jgi:hypothetical protein